MFSKKRITNYNKPVLGIGYSQKIPIYTGPIVIPHPTSNMSMSNGTKVAVETIAARALVAGALSGTISYFLLKKKDAVSIFGFNMPEW